MCNLVFNYFCCWCDCICSHFYISKWVHKLTYNSVYVRKYFLANIICCSKCNVDMRVIKSARPWQFIKNFHLTRLVIEMTSKWHMTLANYKEKGNINIFCWFYRCKCKRIYELYELFAEIKKSSYNKSRINNKIGNVFFL